MTNADEVPEQVRAFLYDWKVVVQNREVTDSARWRDLLELYHKAQQAITDQIALWQQDVLASLSELKSTLSVQLERAGVPTSIS